MSSEAFTPITSIQEPSLQGMPRTYISQREVAAEWEPPVRGTVVGDILPRYKTHIVLDAQAVPKSGKRVAVISHCSPPSWLVLSGSDNRAPETAGFLYHRQVVPTPSDAAIAADHLSTYEPIDETKSLRITRVPLKKKSDGTYESGYPNQQVKSIGVDNLIPAKLRGQTVTIETTTTEVLAAADASDIPTPAFPSPRGNVVKIVHQKISDDFYLRTVTEEIIEENATAFVSPSLEDQLYVTTEILVAEGSQPDSGTGIVESTVQAIGNGKAVKTSKIAVTAYTNKDTWTPGYAVLLGMTVGDAGTIPVKFRSAQGFATWKFKVQASAPPTTPALGAGSGIYEGYTIVERTSRQIQENGSTDVFEMAIVGLVTASAPLVGYGVGDGDLRTTITEELVASSSLSLPANTATAKYTADALGNGMHVKQAVEQDVFAQKGYAKSIPDIIPQKFRALVPENTTEETVVGEATLPSLDPGELSKSERQATAYTKRTSVTSRDVTSLPVSLTDTLVDNEGILVQRVQTLDDGAQTITPSATVSGQVDALGNGLTLKTEDTKAEVFDSRTISHAQTVNIPAKFVIGEETESEIVAGTNAVPAELGSGGSGVVTASSQRVDAYKIRIQKTTRELLDGALVGEQTDTWGVNTSSEEIVNDGATVPSGFGIKNASVSPIGGGKAIEQVENYPAPADPTAGVIYSLYEQDMDDRTGIIIDIDKHLVDASKAKDIAASLRAAGKYPEIKALDKWHSIIIAPKIDSSTVPSSETWIESANFSLPNLLLEVGVIWDAKSDGDSAAAGTDDNSSIESEEISWNVSATAVAFGSVSGRPYTKIQNGRSGVGQVSVVRTFHEGPPSNDISAHEFVPVYGFLTIHGLQAQRQAKSFARGYGAIRVASGGSYKGSQDIDLAIHQFGPVEYTPGISITQKGNVPVVFSQYYATTGSLPGAGTYPAATATVSIEGKADLELPPSSMPLQSGDEYVIKVAVQPWRYGYWVKEVYTLKIP